MMVVTGQSLLCAAIMAEEESEIGTSSEDNLEQDSLEVGRTKKPRFLSRIQDSSYTVISGSFQNMVKCCETKDNSVSELYRSSDSLLSPKLVPTFADRGVLRGQRGGFCTAVISVF
jgi:hypothetical protein